MFVMVETAQNWGPRFCRNNRKRKIQSIKSFGWPKIAIGEIFCRH